MAIRVLHLIDSGGLYGAERMLLSLVAEQRRQGLEPMILSAGEPGIGEKPLEAEAHRLGLPLAPWRMRPGLNLRETGRILAWARAQGFHLLHSHGYKFNVLCGLWPARLRALPLVCTLHGYVRAPRWTKGALYEALDRLMLRRLDRIVIVNEGMRALLPAALASFPRCRFIANGIAAEPPSTAPAPAAVERLLGRHPVTLVAVGRLSREKGFDRLVDVFATHRQSLSALGLVIVGEGRERASLEAAIAAAGLQEQVLLAGYCPDVTAWLPRFHALVMPSRTEGLPITVLEAMRARVPIIASAVGGLPAVLEDVPSALLLPPQDDAALADALIRWCHGDFAAMDTAVGEALFRQRYVSDRMAAAYTSVYEDVLDVRSVSVS